MRTFTLRIILMVAMFVSVSVHAVAAEFVFEVPVNIASIPDAGLVDVTDFRVTCRVLAGTREIGKASKLQRLSGPYRGDQEIHIIAREEAGAKANNYSCMLELCASVAGVANCIDPRPSAPAGSMVKITGPIQQRRE